VGLGLTLALAALLPAASGPQPAVRLKILLPLGRKAYQPNERIDLAVVRSSAKGLPASDLKLSVRGAGGSHMTFTFPLKEVKAGTGEARQTEHLHLNGWLLRPGDYTVEVTSDGATAKTEIDVHSHVRKSPFKLIDWGSRAKPNEQAALGEDSLGFNLLYASYGGLGADETIRGGLDYMWNCTMSGAHQMDIRMECDWSDPYVLAGGTARVVRRAFQDRVHPNCVGVHFYDEPGLTWHTHPKTKEFTPHNIPSQDRAFESAFGRPAPQYYRIKPSDPNDKARWLRWGRWKESFMEAAWKHAAFGVNHVRPDYLPVTQSVYGWSAFTDGYYFNVVRSLPVISGHGGYDDYGGAYFNPGYTFEFGRMRDLHKPNWYLPAWYSGMPANRFRLEQYLSFMSNLQGMAKPPDLVVHRPSQARATADGIVESNKLMARLGTIFTALPVTRPKVAVLYSLSHNLENQTRDMKDNYDGGGHGRQKTFLIYLAGKLIHQPLFPVVEEDVVDGTLAAHHEAVVLPGVNYLPSKVIKALEAFAANGGAVLLSDDSKVKVKGAVKLGCPIDVGIYRRMAKAWDAKNMDEYGRLNNAGAYVKTAEPVARALKKQLDRLGIPPVLECDNPSVIVSRQARGDFEYLFAVNAGYDAGVGGMNAIKTGTAKIRLPADGRPVYNAVVGGPAAGLKPSGNKLAGEFRFGPGQMRVFARSARPIGGVQALTPAVLKDYTLAQEPVRVEVGAVVTDARGRVLSGSAPLHVRVIDPLGVTRYDLYRATSGGAFKATLPLAANDPRGEWKVVIRELLANTEDTAKFTYTPPAQCGALAGATRRAVSFGDDRNHIYRLFQTHKKVTIATGKSAYNAAAAGRLVRSLKDWGVRATVVKAADIKPREVGMDEAYTWCGLEPGKVRPTKLPADIAALLKSGPDAFLKKFDKNKDGFLTKEEVPEALAPFFDRYDQNNDKKLDKNEIAGIARPNSPSQVGFDVPGPVVLLGTPQDNPLIDFLEKSRFLPYKPDATDFPGPGRGLLAWQRDGVGYGLESVTLIAYDTEGMAEAVGSLSEAVSGLRPLTRWKLPETNAVTAASKAPARAPEPTVAWKTLLPDRAAAVHALPKGRLVILTEDGSLTALDAGGKALWQETISGGDAWALDASADGKVIAVGASQRLLGFTGEGKRLFDLTLTEAKPVPVVTFVAVAPDGKHVAAGADNGKLMLLTSGGKRLWAVGGVNPKDKNARPNPYLAGLFTADSKTLIALTQNEAHVVGLADGKVTARSGGASGRLAPQRAGANVLLSDAGSAVLFSPGQNKVVQRTALPGAAGVVSLALAGDDVVIGAEIDGLVWRQKAGAGVNAAPVWEHKTPGRLVKHLATHEGLTVVAYWGGLVRVFDAAGKVKWARAFEQDVAALAWNGEDVVAALADGRVQALKGK
jgi:hypothetical protein